MQYIYPAGCGLQALTRRHWKSNCSLPPPLVTWLTHVCVLILRGMVYTVVYILSLHTTPHTTHHTPKHPQTPTAEIGPSYVFLASGEATQFTGQVLHPNGGTVVNG